MKKIMFLFAFTFIISCKSQIVSTKKTAVPIESTVLNKIIANHYNVPKDFSTLFIKADVKFRDNFEEQNVTAEIKIKKNEQILVIIRFLGITMAKASITPARVSYYEKIKGTYFEGDYGLLSQWLGTDLDYSKIQNMLVGEALDDLKQGEFTESHLESQYKLKNLDSLLINKSFYINPLDFTLNKQEFEQREKARKIEITYSNNKQYSSTLIPTNIIINAYNAEKKTEINLNYSSITCNEELSFLYNIPDGYNKIIH